MSQLSTIPNSYLWCWLSVLLCVSVAQAQPAPVTTNDSDGDQIVDTVDVDDDNDGISDQLEISANGSDLDSDGDGLPNRLDLDSDNDGVLDWQESGAVIAVDFSGVRVVAGRLLGDVGENGLLNLLEAPADTGRLRYALIDSDGDTQPDYIDLDADNDGAPDLLEAGLGTELDLDGDARIDAPPGSVGSDGILDSFQSTNDVTCCDFDGDGVDDELPRNTDLTDLPDFQDLDSDNDQTSDLVEMGGVDADGDGRVDNFFDSAPIDGMDDVLLRIPLVATDLNGNGVEDQIDPFAIGHQDNSASEVEPPLEPDTESNPGSVPDMGQPAGEDVPPTALPVDDGNEVADGVLQTGTNASGCSVGSTTIDALLPLLALLSIACLGWRMTLRRVR